MDNVEFYIAIATTVGLGIASCIGIYILCKKPITPTEITSQITPQQTEELRQIQQVLPDLLLESSGSKNSMYYDFLASSFGFKCVVILNCVWFFVLLTAIVCTYYPSYIALFYIKIKYIYYKIQYIFYKGYNALKLLLKI